MLECSYTGLTVLLFYSTLPADDCRLAKNLKMFHSEVSNVELGHAGLECADDVQEKDINRKAVLVVLRYIQSHFPFWNLHQGRNHIWTLPFDHGCAIFS